MKQVTRQKSRNLGSTRLAPEQPLGTDGVREGVREGVTEGVRQLTDRVRGRSMEGVDKVVGSHLLS